MNYAIRQIMRFQQDRGLDKQPFDADNEAVNIVEELLEMNGYDVPKEERSILKHEWVRFVERQVGAGTAVPAQKHDDTDRIDALGDIIVFAVGAIMKLGYHPEYILTEVAKEINSRSGKMVDGKFVKDENAEIYKANFKWSKL